MQVFPVPTCITVYMMCNRFGAAECCEMGACARKLLSLKAERWCEKAYLTVVFLHRSLADLSSARVRTAFGVCLWDKESLDLRPGFACMYSPLCLEIIAQTVMSKKCTSRACFCSEQLAAHSCVLAPASTRISTISTCPCACQRLFSTWWSRTTVCYVQSWQGNLFTSSMQSCLALCVL